MTDTDLILEGLRLVVGARLTALLHVSLSTSDWEQPRRSDDALGCDLAERIKDWQERVSAARQAHLSAVTAYEDMRSDFLQKRILGEVA